MGYLLVQKIIVGKDMEKEVYDNYIKEWKSWREKTDQYYSKRVQIIRDDSLSSEEQSELLDSLMIEYGRKGFSSEYFGPWTEIRDREDLENPEFILPGKEKCYKDTIVADKDVPGVWGKIAQCCFEPDNKGRIVGLGYDSGDYYLIIKKDDGSESTILMNSHYTIIEED